MSKYDSCFRVENKGDKTAEVFIYGNIWDDKFFEEDVTPGVIKNELEKAKGVNTLITHYHSGGGGVRAGKVIYNLYKEFKAHKIGVVDGIAASTAGWLFEANDETWMHENAEIMIHPPSGAVFGTSSDMRSYADYLDGTTDIIIDMFMAKDSIAKKNTREQVVELMNKTTYMYGKEAFEKGFATKLLPNNKMTASVKNNIATVNGIDFDLVELKGFPIDRITENCKKTNDFPRLRNGRSYLNNIIKEALDASTC